MMRADPKCVVRRVCCALLLGVAMFCGFAAPAISVSGNPVFSGKVTDGTGVPVEGAMVFVYGSPDVNRPADFISAQTEKDGLFRIVISPGKYWAVARVKKAEGFGPLMPGDKHSGEPHEVEIEAGRDADMNFTVTDLKEAIRIRTKEREGLIRIGGRINDEQGVPVRDSYAIASKKEDISGASYYLSAWVDDDGRFTIFVPRGDYYLGSAVIFPPGKDYVRDRKISVIEDRMDINIVRQPRESK